MAKSQFKKNYLDYYTVNEDYSGERHTNNKEETVQFKQSSSIRIWYNEQTVSYDEHWHNALEVIMPVENHYQVVIKGTTYTIQPGELLIIPPNELHRLIAPKSGIRFIFLFDISLISKIKGYSSIQTIYAHPLHICKDNFPYVYEDIYQCFVQIRNEYFNKTEFADLTIYSLLIQILVKLGYNHVNSFNDENPGRMESQKKYVKKFTELMDYIDEHYMEDLTLENIADEIGFSKFHFSRLFKQYTNFTFCDYLTHRRIKAAQALLCNEELSITEIALQSGFSSISTFNRIFKQETGCTPSEYRSKSPAARRKLTY